ncbi:16S rRNA processing protein RimM [hydrothermal vent metagenome]|uniref:16S rRNA processing protein RimM n=1 Tax=hydrothermal vent metagenome TaxID=652676 RepID=A0A3B1BNI0_9ZZZZ
MDEMILLGRVSGLFGIKGWVKLRSDTGPQENILSYSPIYLEYEGQWQAFEIRDGKKQGKSIIARLGECADRDAAALLVGARIAIKREQLPDTEDDEYYWRDLVGLKVSTLENVDLGVITEVMETGANDVIAVRTEEGGQERLLPFIQGDVIKEIDLEQGRMTVDWDPEF